MFINEFLKISPNLRNIQTTSGKFINWPVGDCFLGIPSDEVYGIHALAELPEHITGFHFYLGSNIENLISAFVDSQYPKNIKRLFIGDYAKGSGRDYANIVSILSNTYFPNLEVFELGVWQLFSNAHCLYGNLGNISPLLSQMPNLKSLHLYGKFDFSYPIELNKLEELSITSDDPVTGVNAGASSELSILNLLSSNYPNLKQAYIDLENDKSNEQYQLPKSFLSGKNTPKLQQLEITGIFLSGEKQKLKNSMLLQNSDLKVLVEDMK